MGKKKGGEGIGVLKGEDISEWYSEVVQKADLADYSPIKGFMVIRPGAYSVWEKIQEELNNVFRKKGVRNAYFPLLIPESFFKKEAEHAKGFSPELAYVKNSDEGEMLAIRPTSETIMYDSYSKWIRSWRDLPWKMNQWCNVLRWEVKQTKPFLRTREFLWQEGHCAFEDEKGAEEDMMEMISAYKKLVEDVLAVPVLIGQKSKMETFAGAKRTMSIEALMPDGKALQCGTAHNLGQGFAKVFDVKFKDKDEQEKFVWQTSWGVSTRLIGALIMVHGDDKGLVLPPNSAEKKIVVVPIMFEKGADKISKKSGEVARRLDKYGVILDDREGYSPGWKFNEWELKGIPLRIEIGPKDLEGKQVTIARRDTGKKEQVKEKDLQKRVKELLDEMQRDMFDKAKKFLDSSITKADSLSELKKELRAGKIVKIYLVDEEAVEGDLKEKTGATSRIVENVKKSGRCIISGKETNTIAWVAKGY